LCEPELRPKCAATPTLTYKQSAHGLLSRDGSALRIDVFAKVRVDAAVLHRVGEQIAPSPYGLSATMCSHGLPSASDAAADGALCTASKCRSVVTRTVDLGKGKAIARGNKTILRARFDHPSLYLSAICAIFVNRSECAL
jgi:hypothetical protein